MSDSKPDSYRQAVEQFVLLWGEMATAWGINKTMAQIHALLYAESGPLDTDSIMSELGISRGNANMNLRNLVQWQLIHKVHYKGERKDYYTAEKDVLSMVSTLIRERQQREIAPIRENLEQLCNLPDDGDSESAEAREFRKKIKNFTEFLEMFERFTDALLPYINKKNLKFLKQIVKIAEARQSLKKKTDEIPDIKLNPDE
ncbi:MAG: hypothetical protein WEC12_03505 [Balneolaceae bacterium]